MTRSGVATIGLFADGPVGAAVMEILSRRAPAQLAYVVVPSRSSLVAARHAELGVAAPLVCWPQNEPDTGLPTLDGAIPDVVFLAWWPRIVSGAILQAGQAATLNMHPSLLPHGRGKDPNFWALAEGEPYGVTIHHVDEGVDSGDVAFQSAIAVGWEDTGESLYARATSQLVEMFEGSLDAILSLRIPRLPQPEGRPGRRRKDIEPRCELDLDATMTCRDLLNLLRARTFPPYPGCRFKDAEGEFQVRVQIERLEE